MEGCAEGVQGGALLQARVCHAGCRLLECLLAADAGQQEGWAPQTALHSNPVAIQEINGIDPSLFFDTTTNKTYLLYNSVAPNNKPLCDGHRTIRMVEFDIKHLKVIGEEKIIVNGGTDLSKKPVWIECPHLFKKDEYYF